MKERVTFKNNKGFRLGTVSFSSDFQDSINTDRCKFKAADA